MIQAETEKNMLQSERSEEVHSLKLENKQLRKENMRLQMEVRVYKLVISMVQHVTPNSLLYSCVHHMKMTYAMFIKAKYMSQLTSKAFLHSNKKNIN